MANDLFDTGLPKPMEIPKVQGMGTDPQDPTMQPLFSNTASATGSGAPTLAASSSSPAMPSLPSIDPPKVSPTLSTVQGNETVKGQLGDLFDTANPLMVQARERASRSATGRGLQNSSLATQAGEQAFIGSALPIAQQDAQTYSQRAQQNNATENQFKLSEQQFGQQSALSRQQNAERLVELAAQGDVQAKLQLQKFGFDTSLSAQENIQKLQQQAAAGDIQAQLALAQFGYQKDLTTLQGEIAKDAQTLAHAQKLQELAASGDVQAKLQLQQFGFNTQLSAQENINRLAQLSAQGDINAKLQLQQFSFQSLLAEQQQGYTIQLEDQRFQNQQSLVVLDYGQRAGLSAQESQQELTKLNQQHANTLEQIRAQAGAQQGMDTAAATRSLQNNYLMNVAQRQNQTSQEIASIYSTQGLTTDQQNQAVQNAYNRMLSDITLLQGYYASSPLWDRRWADPPATTPTTPTPQTSQGANLTIAPTDYADLMRYNLGIGP